MPRRAPAREGSDDRDAPVEQPVSPAAAPPAGRVPGTPSLAGLGIAGISRRRIAWAGLTLVAAWIVVGLAGQAGEGVRAADQLSEQQALYDETAAHTAALRQELALVTQERWILQQARAYQLGTRKERPFVLAPDAPPLPADAPGSAATRLGAAPEPPSPLEAWLEVLFGARR